MQNRYIIYSAIIAVFFSLQYFFITNASFFRASYRMFAWHTFHGRVTDNFDKCFVVKIKGGRTIYGNSVDCDVNFVERTYAGNELELISKEKYTTVQRNDLPTERWELKAIDFLPNTGIGDQVMILQSPSNKHKIAHYPSITERHSFKQSFPIAFVVMLSSFITSCIIFFASDRTKPHQKL